MSQKCQVVGSRGEPGRKFLKDTVLSSDLPIGAWRCGHKAPEQKPLTSNDTGTAINYILLLQLLLQL